MTNIFHPSMGSSESLDKFLPAFLAFQKEAENVERGRENPFFNSSYATLASILDHVMPILNKNGLAVLQSPSLDPDSGTAFVTTVLIHESGQFICGTHGAKPAKAADGQVVGSITSYLRRYGLAAILGITQADDDGNTQAQGKRPEATEIKSSQGPKPALRSRGGEAPTGDEATTLGTKSMSRWPKIRERLMADGMTDVQAESKVAKYREDWAAEAGKESNGDIVTKIKGILRRQEDWAKDAGIVFEEGK